MQHLSLSRDGTRLTLTVRDQRPLRAACAAIRGAQFCGTSAGLAVYSYPALADVYQEIRTTFSPTLDERARATVERLERSAEAIALANERKGATGALVFEPHLRLNPMAHQVEAMNFTWSLFQAGVPGAALLMEQGTGKSLCAIGLANALRELDRITWALVLCPNSLKGTWGAEDGEVHKHSRLDDWPLMLRGTRDKRLTHLRAALEGQAEDSLLWVITNYEQLAEDPRKSEHQHELHAIIRDAGPGLLIADESTMVKNPRAKRTRAVHELAHLFPFRMILTGTPITKNPLDGWAQFEVLDHSALGFPTFIGFERTYAMHERRTVGRGRSRKSFVEVVGFRNLDDLQQRVARLSYRVRAEDCLDLPPVSVQRIGVTVSPAQDRALRGMAKEAVAFLDSGQALDGRNILTRYLRMAQVLGGWVPTLNPDGTPGPIEALDPNPKLDAAREWLNLTLEDPTHKVVVFCQFRKELAELEQLCKDAGWGVGMIHGGVKEAERDHYRQAFQTNPDTRVMLCQYQAGSKGLTLTAAQFLLFYSLTFSLEDYLQARKRVHRIGQDQHVTEAYLVAQGRPGKRGGKPPRTLDQVMLQALEDKRQLADLVTGDAARELLEEL